MKSEVLNEKRGFLGTLRHILGFNRNPAYIEDKLKEGDVRSALFLSAIVGIIEIWMILRYIRKYVIEDPKCKSIGEFFDYTNSYWILLGACVFIFVYSLLYLTKKLGIAAKLSRVIIFMFFCLGIYFGFTVAQNDFSKGRMITCFLTMLMWSTVICIWRPFTSVLITLILGCGFHYVLDNHTFNKAGERVVMNEGDEINFFTFLVIILILQLAVYFQRYRDARSAYKLKLSSVTDELTGIPNMRKFDEQTKEYSQKCIKDGRYPLYLVFDLMNFRTFNDRFGYSGGDELLTRTGEIISECFSGEPYAREAGDVFCVLTGREDYKSVSNDIRERIKSLYSEETYLNVRVGAYRPASVTDDARKAIDRARYALKQIKVGEEFFREYDEKMEKDHSLRQYVLNNVEKAVREGYIKVFFQPVISSMDGTICGCEALARWIDPDMGFMSPGVFIPVLEEGRQIHKLDLCIYEQVCKRIRDCLDSGLPALPTSLNFSRLDFELMDAVGELEKLVEKYRIPKEYLHVEITESAITNDVEGLKSAMRRLHESGYVIWLDDFGSGYSSLNVLKDLNFDLLKIDMEFLRNFSMATNAPKIVGTIIELAQKLGMETLAEGVETKETVDFLISAGCGRLQGYYYGKPMPYDDILANIKDGKYKVNK